MNFEHFIDRIIKNEGGFVDHPSDRGGPTNYGITQAVARANGYDGPMKDMPLSFAREVYRKRYIVRPGFDKVALISEKLADELIDTGVNMGPNRPGEFLQRWLNAFNARGSQYADLFVDGAVGPATLDALRKFLRWRGAEGEQVLCGCLNSLQAVRYLEIAERDPSQEDFVYGQVLHRVVLQEV